MTDQKPSERIAGLTSEQLAKLKAINPEYDCDRPSALRDVSILAIIAYLDEQHATIAALTKRVEELERWCANHNHTWRA